MGRSQDLVLFGTGQVGELAKFYFESDSDYRPVAFTVDGGHLSEERFEGLPVIPFEELGDWFPPSQARLFAAISYRGLNSLRRRVFEEGCARGYAMPSYVSSKATVLTDLSSCQNCFILEDNTLQPKVVVGDNVIMWSGNHIGHHSVIEDHCFIASHVVISGNCVIGESSFIGVNATLHDGVTVGAGSILSASALVKDDVPPDSVLTAAGARCSDRRASEVIL
jgi:sugar O-acyltransferase (sialic acid O-acetyltransferase NeuD family)